MLRWRRTPRSAPARNPQTFRTSEREEARVRPRVPPAIYARLVGGSSVHFTANFWRFHPSDFNEGTKWGPIPGADLVDWPITYDDLEPYYDRVEDARAILGPPKEPSEEPAEPAEPAEEKPAEEKPAEEKTKPEGIASDPLQRTVMRLAGWPSERSRRAAERLIVQKEKSIDLVRNVLVSQEKKLELGMHAHIPFSSRRAMKSSALASSASWSGTCGSFPNWAILPNTGRYWFETSRGGATMRKM